MLYVGAFNVQVLLPRSFNSKMSGVTSIVNLLTPLKGLAYILGGDADGGTGQESEAKPLRSSSGVGAMWATIEACSNRNKRVSHARKLFGKMPPEPTPPAAEKYANMITM